MVYRSLAVWWRRPSSVRWGGLRRTSPISRSFGLDRGNAIDRYYIEKFLLENAALVQGRVLEVGDAAYTQRFGRGHVASSDVLHAVAGNSEANLVGDLCTGEGIPKDTYDCIILTQTLPFIYDLKGAVAATRDALKPGGTLLVTLPGICQISRYDMERWGDYWRFTDLAPAGSLATCSGRQTSLYKFTAMCCLLSHS